MLYEIKELVTPTYEKELKKNNVAKNLTECWAHPLATESSRTWQLKQCSSSSRMKKSRKRLCNVTS